MIAFIQSSAIPANAITLDNLAHYNFVVVTISYFLAVAGSFVAISLLKVTRASEGWFRITGVFFGAVVMATAIWTMHYTGMMAYSMQMEQHYEPLATALSGGLAFAFALIAFIILTGRNFQLWHSIAAAPLLGMGVATMHYVGMAAMDMQGDMY